jgi:DinB family protein
MQHDLQDTISLLSRTPAVLNALLRDLPETWTQRNEGKNTWCALEVVAHLIYGERTDWIPRTKILLQFGESKAFEPFDRAGHVQESQGKSLEQLLDEFARMRAESLAELRALNLRPEDLTRRGRHPAFGPVTLSQLLAAWVGHDLTHLHQISRIMAHQYREAVGPFSAYLGVLHCVGHRVPA